jgi:hypothetical protein
MSAKPFLRRLVVLFVPIPVLLAALTPGAANVAFVILVTLCFFIVLVVKLLLPHLDQPSHAQQGLALSAFSLRPPPAR